MAIVKYVPPKKKIIDHRNSNGGYYVAKCEICQTEFYPARGNAKYCCYNCGLISHRMAVANGTATKRKPKKKSEGVDYSKCSFEELKIIVEGLIAGNLSIPQEIKTAIKEKYGNVPMPEKIKKALK